MAALKVHYAGEIIWESGSILPGWAACCSGDKAVEIAERGNHTYDRNKVTCRLCMRRIVQHDAFAPRYEEICKERRAKS